MPRSQSSPGAAPTAEQWDALSASADAASLLTREPAMATCVHLDKTKLPEPQEACKRVPDR